MGVIYESMVGIENGVRHVRADHDSQLVQVFRVKDRFSTPSGGGWSDVLFNAMHGNSSFKTPFEMQLVHSKMFVLRQSLGGHASYSQFRTAVEMVECLADAPVIGLSLREILNSGGSIRVST